MIIVGQNKKMICNYENATSISVKKDDGRPDFYNIYINLVNGKSGLIAAYTTEERCIEVLQEIADFYNNIENIRVLENLDVLSILDHKHFVYTFPEV